MGDARTYDYTIGIRADTSINGITTDWERIPWDVFLKISTRVNEVKHVPVWCMILRVSRLLRLSGNSINIKFTPSFFV